jgi:hypothetical protein
MAAMPLREKLLTILHEKPSYVGELAYAADEDLSRTFGKLMSATYTGQTAPEELLRNLEAFGEALGRVGDRYARVAEYYNTLRQEASAAVSGSVPTA